MVLPFLFTPQRHGDDRGWFEESWSARTFAALGIETEFVQDNHSFSAAQGTLRGVHFQSPPHGQIKLVRCTRGQIWDVVVDLRAGSPSYGRWQGVELSATNGLQIYVPVGFGHGFVTLCPDCEIMYKVSDFYSPECDGGIAWDDPDVAIDWPIEEGPPHLSVKDQILPQLSAFESPFVYDGEPFTTLEPR
ncbi:MAG: dTDP-4-dehydrorhamnose 3,5-epimerase [Parasphingorhabdus sp.]|nr:dTDP-4-dehydrorhamnose 3,5-epimerase [Parasphingorhabdus sp.]